MREIRELIAQSLEKRIKDINDYIDNQNYTIELAEELKKEHKNDLEKILKKGEYYD